MICRSAFPLPVTVRIYNVIKEEAAMHTQKPLRKSMRSNSGRRMQVLLMGLVSGMVCLIFAGSAFGAQADAADAQLTMPSTAQLFTFLFLMLGPIKIIGPFAKMTHGAEAGLTRTSIAYWFRSFCRNFFDIFRILSF